MQDIISKFEYILDDNEQVLWATSPTFIPFLATGIPFLILGIGWGFFDYFLLTGMIEDQAFAEEGVGKYFPYLFLAAHSFPCWGSILNMFRLAFVFSNTAYAITDKRILLRSGFFGIDYKSIDHDKIQDITVDVNPLERIYNVGTIKAYSGNSNSKGNKVFDEFVSIDKPYDVFKLLKGTNVNVKTDWSYPNAMRPENNPGYNTKLQ